MRLLGSPELPFARLFNLTVMKWRSQDHAELMGLVVALGAYLRQPQGPGHGTAIITLYLAVGTAALVTDLCWRAAGRRTPDGGSYTRWREALIALYVLWVLSWGIPAIWLRNYLNVRGGSAARGGAIGLASHVLLLLFCSFAPVMATLWGRPLRASLALPVHLLSAVGMLRHNSTICSGAALAAPAAQQLTSWLFRVLGLLRLSMQPMISASPVGAPPDKECAGLLGFLQLSLGLAAPAVVALSQQVRMFMQHQRERLQQGMPAESGWNARLYGWLGCMCEAAQLGGVLPCLWAAALAWELALLVA